jgi:hypothetical protein
LDPSVPSTADPAALEAENARLHARVEELERKLYPPPPTPKKQRDRNRYVLAPAYETDGPLKDIQELFTGWALDYARERHGDLQWHRVFRWKDIPEHGIYTTARAASDAKRAEVDVPVYEIDKRWAALGALDAERQRLHDHITELISDAGAPKEGDHVAHRVWAYRFHILREAAAAIERVAGLVRGPLVDYDDVIRAATRVVDDVLERERQVTLETIPGYRPDGSWTCDKCGYPFDDSAGFTCDACHEADPKARDAWQRLFEEIASNDRLGGQAAADRLAAARDSRLERLRWAEVPAAVNPC